MLQEAALVLLAFIVRRPLTGAGREWCIQHGSPQKKVLRNCRALVVLFIAPRLMFCSHGPISCPPELQQGEIFLKKEKEREKSVHGLQGLSSRAPAAA